MTVLEKKERVNHYELLLLVQNCDQKWWPVAVRF
jgi:hypothetical protein